MRDAWPDSIFVFFFSSRRRHTRCSRDWSSDVCSSDLRKRAAVFREFAFALEDVDVDAGLIVEASGVKFLRARGNRGIARNDFRDRATVGLDAERKRRDVEQQHVFYALVENIGLDSGAEGDDFIGI